MHANDFIASRVNEIEGALLGRNHEPRSIRAEGNGDHRTVSPNDESGFAVALFRAEKEEILDVAIEPENPATATAGSSPYELRIMKRFGINDRGRPGDKWLMDTARWAWRAKI